MKTFKFFTTLRKILNRKMTTKLMPYLLLFALSNPSVARRPQEAARTWPIEPPVILTSCYGWRKGEWHDGIDIGKEKSTSVYATGAGRVFKTCNASYEKCNSYGTHVVIKHDDGSFTTSAHLSRLFVKNGRRVKTGQKIGLVGNTGNARGPHLHFAVHYSLEDFRHDNGQGTYLRDPLNYLPEIEELIILSSNCKITPQRTKRGEKIVNWYR